jgi:hypothetical protein
MLLDLLAGETRKKNIPAYFTYSFLHLPTLICLDYGQDKKVIDVISRAVLLTWLIAIACVPGIQTGSWVVQRINYLRLRLVCLWWGIVHICLVFLSEVKEFNILGSLLACIPRQDLLTDVCWGCEHAGLLARMGAHCFCTAWFTFPSRCSETPPGTAVVFPPAALVGHRGIVNAGGDQWEMGDEWWPWVGKYTVKGVRKYRVKGRKIVMRDM